MFPANRVLKPSEEIRGNCFNFDKAPPRPLPPGAYKIRKMTIVPSSEVVVTPRRLQIFATVVAYLRM